MWISTTSPKPKSSGLYAKVANATVRDEIATRQADTKLSDYSRSSQGILDWLEDALRAGGEAMFGSPNVRSPHQAREQLQSKYVLKVIATHLGRIGGSVLDAPEDAYPIGALALSAAAVQRSFQWYLKDQPKGVKQATFSSTKAGALTGFWQESAVADLMQKPHRLQRLLDRAADFVSAPSAKAAAKAQAASIYFRERSSSPLHHA
ncbi:hypothetical protein OH77DRAFT_1498750 [Trametes cingulata]|nr:hypothetical protein OH77DRAFT_1498750 [Trametes cingulata]